MRRLLHMMAFSALMIFMVVYGSASDQQTEIKSIDGYKLIHNAKVPSDKAFRNLVWREDLVIGGETLAEDYILALPTEIIADTEGNIYILDDKDCHVKKYDSRGKFITRLGRRGQGPGEFESPVGICLDEKGDLLVGDFVGRIEFFDSHGTYLESERTDRFYRFKAAPGGEFIYEREMRVGETSQVQRIRRIVAVRTNTSQVLLASQNQLPFGAIQNQDFRFEIPLYLRWDVTPSGRLRVGTANRYEIREIALDGKILFAFTKDYEPLPVPSIIQSAAFKQVAGAKLPAMLINPNDFREYLKHYPIFKSVTADEKGRTWIELFQLEHQDRSKVATVFDVFSADGIFLFSTSIGADFAARPYFKNGSLYALRRDAKGYFEAVRYRLPAGL